MSFRFFPDGFCFRKAEAKDVDAIHDLLADYAKEHLLLPRTKEDLAMRIGNFHVIELHGEFAGCVALRHYGNELYEVRSLAIMKKHCGKQLGTAMVQSLLNMLKERHTAARVFALTYRDNFFHNLGFHPVGKDMFPEKIWSDCSICAKKNCCDEIAVLTEIQA